MTYGTKVLGTVSELNSTPIKGKRIGIVSTGSSNLSAVMRSLSKAGFSPDLIPQGGGGLEEQYDCVILPGVGNFGFVMGELERSGTKSWLKEAHSAGTPILGICLGAQLLFDSSEEAPGVEGLGIIRGSVRKLDPVDMARVPHMGWNEVLISDLGKKELMALSGKSFYFAHSYYLEPSDPSNVIAVSHHSEEFCSIAGNLNCLAIQFHPEKSGRAGQEILRRGVEWLCRVDSQNV